MRYFKADELYKVQQLGHCYVVELACGAVIDTDTITLGQHYGYLPDDIALNCKSCTRECKPVCTVCILLTSEANVEKA